MRADLPQRDTLPQIVGHIRLQHRAGQCTQRIYVRLKLCANGWARKIGHKLRRDAPLADKELLFEFPNHVECSGNTGRSRRAGAQKPHQICGPQRKAPRQIVGTDLWHLGCSGFHLRNLRPITISLPQGRVPRPQLAARAAR